MKKSGWSLDAFEASEITLGPWLCFDSKKTMFLRSDWMYEDIWKGAKLLVPLKGWVDHSFGGFLGSLWVQGFGPLPSVVLSKNLKIGSVCRERARRGLPLFCDMTYLNVLPRQLLLQVGLDIRSIRTTQISICQKLFFVRHLSRSKSLTCFRTSTSRRAKQAAREQEMKRDELSCEKTWNDRVNGKKKHVELLRFQKDLGFLKNKHDYVGCKGCKDHQPAGVVSLFVSDSSTHWDIIYYVEILHIGRVDRYQKYFGFYESRMNSRNNHYMVFMIPRSIINYPLGGHKDTDFWQSAILNH